MPRRYHRRRAWTKIGRRLPPYNVEPVYQYYKPAGSISRIDYDLYKYQPVRLPHYEAGISYPPGSLDNIARFQFEISALRRLLNAPNDIETHFEQSFAAPHPVLTAPNPPLKPDLARVGLQVPQLNKIDPEPVFGSRVSWSPLLNVLLPGVYWLLYRVRAWLERKSFESTYRGWQRTTEERTVFNRRMEADFKAQIADHPVVQQYNDAQARYVAATRSLEIEFAAAEGLWEAECAQYYDLREGDRASVERLRALAASGDDVSAAALCEVTVNAVRWPISAPRPLTVACDSSRKLIHVEIAVPASKNVSVAEFQNGRFKATAERLQSKWYNFFVYSLMIKVAYTICSETSLSSYETLGINAVAKYKSGATGLDESAVIASVLVLANEVRSLDIAHVEPAEAFRSWRGVAPKTLSELAPVQPVMVFDRSDKRIVLGRDVLAGTIEKENLAEMDWEDFEHLVRQLFELEYRSSGAEVRVTRSSRDRGVDAVIFDPDPIKGGKIVIQAKRYTNVVDVSAVRDLFGTVQNEGANRGILVTTSHYGPESFEFARGKPLTLLDGPNLMALLQKHGFNFRVDARAAREQRRGEVRSP